MNNTRRHRRNQRGQTLAEFALVLPILAIIIFGIIDTFRAYNAWVTIRSAAREGVRYGVTGQATCGGIADESRISCIEHTAREQAGSLTNSPTQLDVSIRSWDYPSYDSATVTEGGAGESCDALEVEVSYEFEPATPIMSALVGGVTMTAKQRMVNEPFGTCV
jgi:Flp pilus assembly protein TadG